MGSTAILGVLPAARRRNRLFLEIRSPFVFSSSGHQLMTALKWLRVNIERRTAGRGRSQAGERNRRTRHLTVESLEDRLTPSGFLLVSSFDTNNVLRYNEAGSNAGAFVD